ncbi:hypothetical protein TNCV_5043721 [Trichonephila clavipes]|uniref:Uncharacterized protein n=1 Tax=Trichonephila clavipes TaxID=2585209 RepID=A0A8X7BK84_TRICX|nr:hypothetical protein TNCV_5043721 [Trichonephila clavipes]
MNINIPAYFYEKSKEEQEKLSLIKELLRYLSNDDSNKYWEALRMSEKEAVRLIQIHEQARQGREAFLEAQRLFEIKEENRLKECRKNMKSTISNDLAATRIQRVNNYF